MTAASLLRIRVMADLDASFLALLLGVHLGTIHRWEKSDRELKLDSALVSGLLHHLERRLLATPSATSRKKFGAQLKERLLLHGCLGGVAWLLSGGEFE